MTRRRLPRRSASYSAARTPLLSPRPERNATPDPHERRRPSPGGWESPQGAKPMWDWTPSGGGVLRLDRAPLWIRACYHTPVLDRWARQWLWRHGGWDVEPATPPSLAPETHSPPASR